MCAKFGTRGTNGVYEVLGQSQVKDNDSDFPIRYFYSPRPPAFQVLVSRSRLTRGRTTSCRTVSVGYSLSRSYGRLQREGYYGDFGSTPGGSGRVSGVVVHGNRLL